MGRRKMPSSIARTVRLSSLLEKSNSNARPLKGYLISDDLRYLKRYPDTKRVCFRRITERVCSPESKGVFFGRIRDTYFPADTKGVIFSRLKAAPFKADL